MVRSNLATIASGAPAHEIIGTLRANGYERIALAVQDRV